MSSSSESSIDISPASFAEKWCRTEVIVNKFTYTWTICNFSFLLEQVEEVFESSSFSTGENDSIKWKLRAYPPGSNEKSKDYLSLYLALVSSNKANVRAKCDFSVLDADENEKLITVEEMVQNFVPGKPLGYRNFIERSSLLETPNGLLKDNKLKIYCKIFVYEDPVNTSGQSIYYCKVPKCTLSNDFIKLFDNPKFSDVMFNVSGKEFFAHKAILSSRSPVFAAMFEHDMEEKKHNRVEIVDTDQRVFKEILRFIYTGEATDLNEIAMDLLPAADKYALDRLKAMCENALCSKITVQTASDILALADMYVADQLKAHAFDFVSRHADEVTDTDGWNVLIVKCPQLVSKIVKAITTQSTLRMSPPQK